MAAGEILIKWTSESSAAIRDMNRVNKALGDSASKSDRWARRIDTAGTVAMGVFAGLAGAAWKVTLAASDQEQAVGSLNAVFKKYSGEMETASKAAYELGLSTTDYSQMAAVLGAQLQNLGLETGEAADRTQELVNLGADLAAQFGGTTKEAVDALGSALRGERDPIERYAISLNQAAIDAKMAETGLSEVEAVLALLNEQAKKSGALGAAARESETLAAGLQQTQAAFQNLNASLGKALGGGKKGGALGDLARGLNDLSTWVEENPDTFKKIAGGIAGITTALIALKGALAVIGPLKELMQLFKKFPGVAQIGVITGLVIALYQALKDVDAGAAGALGSLKRFWDLKAPFNGNWWVVDMLEDVVSWAKTAYNWLDTLFGKLNQLLPSWLRINDAGTGIGGTSGTGVGGRLAEAPALLSTDVGRLAPETAQTVTNVYVDGVRTRPRTSSAPLYSPAFVGGVL